MLEKITQLYGYNFKQNFEPQGTEQNSVRKKEHRNETIIAKLVDDKKNIFEIPVNNSVNDKIGYAKNVHL